MKLMEYDKYISMGYKKLGMAFCIGLNEEARYIARYFTNQGFELYSVCCKTCSLPKKELDLKQVNPELECEAMCNPKFQAKFLSEKGVELFISCGLCVGHAAVKAGLGKIGKNGLLLTPQYGNRITLVSILTDLVLLADSPLTEMLCPPNCHRCLDACPTKALKGNGIVEQKLCRSHVSTTSDRGHALCVK